MKFLIISLIFLFGLNSPFAVFASRNNEKTDDTVLENIDAVQAIAIANQWKWSKKQVKSYVNSREVVFKFQGGRVKKFPLPKDKMMIAVAPYIRRTHK
jgi:hypothetical protein